MSVFHTNLSKTFREERLSMGRKLVAERIIVTHQTPLPLIQSDRESQQEQAQPSCGRNSRPHSCLVFRHEDHSDLVGGEDHCSFLNPDNLLLSSHVQGVDVITTVPHPQTHNGNHASDYYEGRMMGRRIGRVSSPLQSTRLLNCTGLWGGKAFVAGMKNGNYRVYDTEQHVNYAENTVSASNSSLLSKNSTSFYENVPLRFQEDRPKGFRSTNLPSHIINNTTTNSKARVSWDFLERGPSCVLALHIGGCGNYFCVNDNRENHHFSATGIYRVPKKTNDRFGLACFVNEYLVATSGATDKQRDTESNPVLCVWDIRYLQQPALELSSPCAHDRVSFERESDPVSQAQISKWKTSRVCHLRSFDRHGRLHIITYPNKAIVATKEKGSSHQTHWIWNAATGECRRIASQTLSDIENGFAMSPSNGLLATASFEQDGTLHAHQTRISFHNVESQKPESFSRKRKHDCQTSTRSFSPEVLDGYHLPSSISRLAWNSSGTRLAGLSCYSDLHVWGT